MKDEEKQPTKLWLLLLLGFVATLLLLVALVYVFAAYSTARVTPWATPEPLTQEDQSGILRSAVTAAAALGVGVTLLLSYRRQRSLEVTQRITAEAQRTAADAQQVAAEALQLNNRQYDLELERHRDARVSELRSRYTSAAEQLGSSAIAVRLAGVYAMATLSDDWGRQGSHADQQTCVEVLCAYFRMLSEEVRKRQDGVDPSQPLRQAVWNAALARLVYGLIDNTRWTGMSIDLREANLTGRALNSLLIDAELDLRESSDEHMRFLIRDCIISSGGKLNLSGASIKLLSFRSCRFEDGELDLYNTSAVHSISFDNCTFLGTEVNLVAGNWDEQDLVFRHCEFQKFPTLLERHSGFKKVSFINCVINIHILEEADSQDSTKWVIRGCTFSDAEYELQSTSPRDDPSIG